MSGMYILRYVNNKFDRRIIPWNLEGEYMVSMEDRGVYTPSEEDFINFLEDFGKHKLAKSGVKLAKQLFGEFEFNESSKECYKSSKEFEEFCRSFEFTGAMYRLGVESVWTEK